MNAAAEIERLAQRGMTSTVEPSWLTPAQLGQEMGRSARWVADHMISGDIPSVKIGTQRFFTPECRALLMQRQLDQQSQLEVADDWGRSTMRRRRA